MLVNRKGLGFGFEKRKRDFDEQFLLMRIWFWEVDEFLWIKEYGKKLMNKLGFRMKVIKKSGFRDEDDEEI